VSTEATYFSSAVAVGLGATLFMDLWALFLKRAFSTPSANYCLVGRWFRHMPEGTFMHASIANASQKRFECTVGWIAHYVIGAVYALVLVALVSGNWLAQPTLLLALLFGVGTVLAPFSSCIRRSDSALLHLERPIQRRPGLEVSWHIPRSESAYMYVRSA